MKRLPPALAILVLLALPAAAQDVAKGLLAYQSGDFAAALQEWRPLAEQGNADAQHGLGILYAEGAGVPQNFAEAVRWYRLAAEQGHASAQLRLGNMYARGNGVPQDYVQAVNWFRLAAEQGYAVAQYSLGVRYDNGLGVPQDYVLAHMWFNLAAAQGFEAAAENRDVMAALMAPAQIAEAQQRARAWLAEHGE